MQQKQPPQYVTHRAQQELIKEFFLAKKEKSPEIRGPVLNNRSYNFQNNNCRIQSHREQCMQAEQLQKQESLLSADCSQINQPNCSAIQKHSFLNSNLALNEPMSAQIPQTSGSVFNSGSIMKNSGCYNASSARGQYMSRHELMHTADRNDSIDRNSFTMGTAFVKCGNYKNSITAESANSVRMHPQQNEASCFASQQYSQRPAQLKIMDQSSSLSNHNQVETHTSQNTMNDMLGFQNGSRPIQNSNKYDNLHLNMVNSFSTGKDFADMVSLETENCLKKKQNSTSPNIKTQQQNYKQMNPAMTSGLTNNKFHDQNQIKIQTAMNDGYKEQQFQQSNEIPSNLKKAYCNSQTTSEKHDQRAQNLKHLMKQPASQKVQQFMQPQSTRVVPQMHMKQLCNALNSTNISSKQSISNHSSNQFNQKKEKPSFDNFNIKSSQNFTTNSYDLDSIAQKISQNNKQPKSYDRSKNQPKGNQGNYSPFQNRLYKQYQQYVPNQQVSNRQNAQNTLVNLQSQRSKLELQESKYQQIMSYNNNLGYQSTNPSRDNSVKSKQQQYQIQHTSQISRKSNLQNPKVLSQKKLESNSNSSVRNSQVHSHTLLSSTGVLAKSNGDKAADSHNQTVLQDSTNQESTHADQNKQNTQAFVRKLDAYDKLEHKTPINALNNTQNVSERGKFVSHNLDKNNKPNSISVQSYKQFKTSHFHNAVEQNDFKQKDISQNLGSAKNHQTIIESENSRLSQLQTSKSACTSSRCHGPTVVSGPQIQISKNCDGQTTNDQKQMNISQRQSQLRQSAHSITNKVQNNSSRKSIGLQQNLNSLGNSRKQLETAKPGSYKTNQVVTIEGKAECHSKLLSYKTHKTPTSNAKNIQLFNKNTVNNQNTCSFASQRAKKTANPSNQMEQSYPKLSPKSSGYQSKAIGEPKQKRNTQQLNGGDSSSNSQLKCRYTPTKTDVQRKAKVSPFKPVKTQSNSYKTTEVGQSNQNVETSHLQTSPEHCSQITAELRYLYERQKKMVAQLSQNKIGKSVQPGQAVPGLSLNNINETVFTNQNNMVKSSQTPKQQQNILTPNSCKQMQNVICNEPKTMRGNTPASYQSLICNLQQPNKNNYNQSNSQAANQYHHGQINNKQFSSNSNQTQNKNQAQFNDNKQNHNYNMNHLRYQNTGISVGTHRDFIQENKKLSSYTIDKVTQNQAQNNQQRTTISLGKTVNNKQNSKEKYRSDMRPNQLNHDKVTPKKPNEKKEQLIQKQKYKTDLSKTQYLSKKQLGLNQQKKQPNQPHFNNFIGSIVKSPSHRALMATQIVENKQHSEINDSLLNNNGFKQLQEKVDLSCNSNLQQYIKNKDKLNKSLNMTINITGSNRQDCSSQLNTQRIINQNAQKNFNGPNNKVQISSNKSQQRYLQTQPEDFNDGNNIQKSQTINQQQMVQYLRTIQNSQTYPENQENLTFATNTNHINQQICNQMNNATYPKLKEQECSINNQSVPAQYCQIQTSECSREQIFHQKNQKQPAVQYQQLQTQNKELANSKYALDNSEVQNIESNKYLIQLSSQIQNVLQKQNQQKDYNNKQDLQYQKLQKTQNQNNQKLSNLADNQLKMSTSNIVSFQQLQEKSNNSTDQRSPLKKYSQKQEKENLNYHLNQFPSNQFQNNLQQLDKIDVIKKDQLNHSKINVSGNKVQNDAAQMIRDNKSQNRQNIQQNVEQQLQGQKQERPVLTTQDLNEKYPDTKYQDALVQTQVRNNKQEINNEQCQVNQAPNVNDTMCFSQKTSLDEYVIGKQIGQGAYAVVRIGLHKPTNKKVALKIYKKFKLEEPNRRKSVKREIKLMDKMKHNSIVQLFEIIDTSKYVILVMEYVGGSSLHGYLKSKSKRRLEEWDAKRIFKQIIEGLKYCHSRCITHRDIKLENLLLDENNQIKIIDFGFSTCIPNDKKIKIFCGTPSYMAPEIVMKTEYCGPPADIWAMGVLLFTILSGQFPYRGATDEELYDKICRADYHLPKEVKESLSPASKDLLAKLFQLNPDDRPTARQILEHQWLYNLEKKDNQLPLNNKDSASLVKSNDYLQLQKRAKSQRLDNMGAPKNKNCDTANPVERRVQINPFNVVQSNNESQGKQNYTEDNNQKIKISQPEVRSNSQLPNKSQFEINNKLIKLISDYMQFDQQQVEIQVKNNIQMCNILANSNKDNSININSNANFIPNLYYRLVEEQDEDKQVAILKQIKQKNIVKSETSISEQLNIFMGSDGKSQQKSDNGYYSANLLNQTQQLLMKSAISQTSLGMSATGTNMTSQGFGQANGLQNLAVQPSIIPSIKSINSASASGNNINENTMCISKFNNTMNPSLNMNKQGYQTNILSSLNFNNTQPLKGILDNLNDTTTSNSGIMHHQMMSSPSTHRDQNLPLNFNQTNIFVTNNNQVYGDIDKFNNKSEPQQNEFNQEVNSKQIQENQNKTLNDYLFKQQFDNIQVKDSNQSDPQSKAYNLLVNNFFTEAVDKSVNNKIEEQESPNFRQRGDSELKY